jgi:hypothetical protein
VLPNWKLAQIDCTNFGSIEPVMAQKRTDYSKFTQPNGTIQVLMLWASVALHLAIGSNLGLFGRLDPIQVKPAGGTVRVVDLTPAEQTRVPEAAKSKPLPIAQIPVNPEPATRVRTIPPTPPKPGIPTLVSPPPTPSPPIPAPSNIIRKQPSVPITPTTLVPQEKTEPIKRKRLSSEPSGTDSSQGGAGTGVGSGVGTGTGKGVGTGVGTGVGIGTGKGAGTGDSTGVGTGTGTGAGTGVGTGAGTGVGRGTGTNEFAKLQAEFESDIKGLENSYIGKDKITIGGIKSLKKSYDSTGSNRRCSRSQSGYILFGLLLKKDVNAGDDYQPRAVVPVAKRISSSLIDGDKLYEKLFQEAYTSLGDDINKDPTKNVLYKFKYEYQSSTCKV